MNATGSTPCQSRWLGSKLNPNSGRLPEGLQGPLGGVEVEGDLGRMDLQPEPDAALAEDVEDRVPALGEELEAGVDHRVGDRRERVEQVPDRRAGEAVDTSTPSFCAARAVSFISSAARQFDALRLAVAPDVRRQDRRRAGRRCGRARPARPGGCRSPSTSGRAWPSSVASRLAVAVVVSGLLRRRSGRPSRPARCRRSPTRWPSGRSSRAGRPTGR